MNDIIENMGILFSGRYKWVVESSKGIRDLAIDLCYNRHFCELSGVDYINPDIDLIEIGIRKTRLGDK